jgi:hypothetical protein
MLLAAASRGRIATRFVEQEMRRTLPSLALLVCSPTLALSQAPPSSPGASPLAALSPFVGVWDCAGKFEGSGKPIEAHVSFKFDLEDHWIFFRHDDKPLFPYHAVGQWGWDEARKEFVMLVEDSGGGVRVFRAPAVRDKEILWTGDGLGSANPPTQRFTFKVLDAGHFFTSCSVLRGTTWILVDSSTCTTK